MAAQPEPTTPRSRSSTGHAVRPSATVVSLRHAEDGSGHRLVDQASGSRLGPARGLLLGLAIGAVLWLGIGLLAWSAFRLG